MIVGELMLLSIQVAVLDEKGKILNNSRIDNNLIKVNEFFDSLHPNNNTKVVMESSGMWYNIYECLSNRHLDVRLSNPAKTRAIASAKIDSGLRIVTIAYSAIDFIECL